MTKLQTFLRHPGNKTRHLKHIIPHLPERYNTYIEPFVGTGALFLNIQPKKWIINDLNEDITNLFKTVRDDLPNIIKLLVFKYAENCEIIIKAHYLIIMNII